MNRMRTGVEMDVADPDPEVSAKAQRRRFPAEYRLRILKEADACRKPGEVGALLRREGLYSSLLTNWRRQRTRLAAYAAHPERFVQGPPRPETLPTAVWINRPPKSTREDAPGATIVTPDDPQHGVIRRSQPISGDRSITLVTSVESLQ